MTSDLFELSKHLDPESYRRTRVKARLLWRCVKRRFRVPKSRSGQFLFFAIENFVAYFTLVANTRAFTQGNYLWTAVTDSAFTLQQCIVGKMIVENKEGRSFYAIMGSTVGGTVGSLTAIWCTKHLYGS